jgi:hypothetical protein
MTIEQKLLISDKTTFEQLTTTEQNLWTRFKTTDIYRFLNGEEDTIPEFQYNWTSIPRLQTLGPTPAAPATPAPAQIPTTPATLPVPLPSPASPADTNSRGSTSSNSPH